LINLKQKGKVIEHIQQFQKLSLRVKNILEDNLLDLLIRTLKESIQHVVDLFEPKFLENAFSLARKFENKIRLLENWSLITIEKIMLPLLN